MGAKNRKYNILEKNQSLAKKYNYGAFEKIDGTHPLRDSVENGFVDYLVRYRKGGKVSYFNFNLAKEMGLITKNHPSKLNRNLESTILKTFSLTIINEYDILNQVEIPEHEIRPNPYMATRYLQLQHPNKRGETSGDGRSIWNGYVKGKDGVTWDISSCGTGATCLSPATAISKKYFKTGDKDVSYGCGYADLSDGISGAILSEIFHNNHIATERTLAVIEYKNGLSVNVRVAKNLLRPSHFFFHLKQSNYEMLKNSIDYFIDRQITNKEFPSNLKGNNRYKYLLKYVTKQFANAAARFESDYIFCWMDWDGDNILTDGGIIDYGSVRQFGLFHHEYRYDDVQRMSTTIPEQKNKAKYIVQTFAQIVDYLITGEKKNISKYKVSPCLAEFDDIYEKMLDKGVLIKMGLNKRQRYALLEKHRKLVSEFRKTVNYFEREKSKKGLRKVQDGVTWDAIFCIRDILRELPQMYFQGKKEIDARDFIEILRSNYAIKKDLELTQTRLKKIKLFQKYYWEIVKIAAVKDDQIKQVLLEISMRSSILNKYDRITGDGIIYVASEILKNKKDLSFGEFSAIINDFIENQILNPEYFEEKNVNQEKVKTKKSKQLLNNIIQLVGECREGI